MNAEQTKQAEQKKTIVQLPKLMEPDALRREFACSPEEAVVSLVASFLPGVIGSWLILILSFIYRDSSSTK